MDAKSRPVWKPRPEFLSQVRKIDDETLDPLRPERQGVVEGEAQRSSIQAGLARTADPTAPSSPTPEHAREVAVAEPVYDVFKGVLDPAKVCGTCRHFRLGHGQAIVNDPRFMQFMVHEAKFIPALRAIGGERDKVELPWFNQEDMGLCHERRGMVTSRVATCTHWSPGEGLQVAVAPVKT